MAAATSISLNDKLIINELLCYLTYKFGKLSLVTLKCTIVDFYSAEKMTEAKETIIKSVDELCIDKWPKPPKRRRDNKAAIEVDDLIGIFSFLDENALINKIPRFVAENIDNLPSTRIEEVEIRCALNKLENIDKKIDAISKPLEVKSKLPPKPTQPSDGQSTTLPSQSRLWADRVLTQSFSGTQHHLTDDGMETGENTDDNDGP